MVIPLTKIKAILLYFSNHTKYLGKIKLMKLFYFLDFMHVKEYGLPVTFDTYYHLEKGPIPSFIMNLVDEASEDGKETLSDIIRFQRPKNTKRMIKALPVRKFKEKDAQIFLGSELDTLKKVCERFYNAKADHIKEASHKEAPWKETRMSQIIPYSLAGKDPDSKFTEQEIELSVKISS
ncbi:MAG: hypothetical protein ACD_26C00020G0001 [uncultured bacterium]|nr:MAG: hypothetical protein ACD_26C00020G0001 [uncultured bacterium]